MARGEDGLEYSSWGLGIVGFGVAVAEPILGGDISLYGMAGLILGVVQFVLAAYMNQQASWHAQDLKDEADALRRQREWIKAIEERLEVKDTSSLE